MPRYQYTVGVNSNILSNVQSIVINKGRRFITDPFRASTIVITGRDINALPAVINIGDTIGVTVQGTTDWPFPTDLYNGYVSDVKLNYGITPDLDTWEIYGEDSLALAGRAFTSNTKTLTAGDTPLEAAQDLSSDFGLTVSSVFASTTSSTVSGTAVPNQNLLDLLNQLAATEQARISGSGTANTIDWIDRDSFANADPEGFFTDGSLTTPGTLDSKFDVIKFFSAADNYATQVIVEPAGLTSQTAGTGDRVFTLKTFDETTGQALNLANYVLASLDVSSDVPFELSVLAEMTTNRLALTAAADGDIGYPVGIVLRGLEYDCFVEGSVISATPESSRFTLFLSSADSKVGFVLDDATFGVLDTNKLGF